MTVYLVAFYHTLTFMVRSSIKYTLYLLISSSGVRLYRSIFCCWGQTCSQLELGMESLPKPQSEISQEPKTSGESSCGSFLLRP